MPVVGEEPKTASLLAQLLPQKRHHVLPGTASFPKLHGGGAMALFFPVLVDQKAVAAIRVDLQEGRFTQGCEALHQQLRLLQRSR
jgi:hypothetical protein